MVDPRILQQTPHWIDGPYPARRDVDVRVPDVFEPTLTAHIPCVRHAFDTLKLEWQHLAHVADDELKTGAGVEEAGGVEAKDVEGGVFVPAPAGDGELVGCK